MVDGREKSFMRHLSLQVQPGVEREAKLVLNPAEVIEAMAVASNDDWVITLIV